MTIPIEKTNRVVELLKDGTSYRNIAKNEKISLSQVQKIANALNDVDKNIIKSSKIAGGVEGIKDQIIEYHEKKQEELEKENQAIREQNESLSYFIKKLGKKIINSIEDEIDNIPLNTRINICNNLMDFEVKNNQCKAHVIVGLNNKENM